MRKLMITASILSALYSGCGFAASFDCRRASLPDEKTICSNNTLNKQDEQMAAYFSEILSCTAMGSAGDLREEQERWLKKRHDCGTDEACLAQLYQKRIDGFRPLALKAKNHAAANDCPMAAEDHFLLGKISKFECGDNCYLTIIDADRKEHTGLCTASQCRKWNFDSKMPASFVGKSVQVEVGVGEQTDDSGNVMGKFPAFKDIMFLH